MSSVSNLWAEIMEDEAKEEGVYYGDLRIGSLKDLKIEKQVNGYHAYYDCLDSGVSNIIKFLDKWRPKKLYPLQEWWPVRPQDTDLLLRGWGGDIKELGHIHCCEPTKLYLSGDNCHVITNQGNRWRLRAWREKRWKKNFKRLHKREFGIGR